MSEKNPSKNICRLRQESGADEVIPSGTYDQYEPATSYKLGNSTMAVDLTVADWPVNGKGIVNTFKVSELVGSQSFIPKGSSLTYTRAWNDTLPDMSDDFSGVGIDSNKWQPRTFSGNIAAVQSGGQLSILSSNAAGVGGVESKFAFQGNFDIQMKFISRTSSGGLYFAVGNTNRIGTSPSGNFNNANWQGFVIGPNSADTQTYVNGSHANLGNANSPSFFRITRTSSVVTLYYKVNIGDVWTQVNSAAYNTNDMIIAIHGEANNVGGAHGVIVDDFVVNSGTPYLISGAVAIWQPWIEIKDAVTLQTEQESYADLAVSTHESNGHNTVTGTFTTNDGKTITVTNGIITGIV